MKSRGNCRFPVSWIPRAVTCKCSFRAIERILNRLLVWARYNDKTTFSKQNEIALGIDDCYRELSACSNRFAVRILSFCIHMKRNAFHLSSP